MPTSLNSSALESGQRPTEDQLSPEVQLRDTINLMIGIAIVIVPWFNGDDALTHGAIRLRFIAIAICAVSLWLMLHQRHALAEWVNAALGAALGTAPFWRGGIDALRVDFAIAGAIVFAFSVSCALQIRRETLAPPSPRWRSQR